MVLTNKNKILISIIIGILMFIIILLPFILITINIKPTTSVQLRLSSTFYIIPLGTSGGLEENNLSAYLLTTVTNGRPNSAYISMDGGTIRHGLQKAIDAKSLPSDTDVQRFFQEQIKGYLISHGHLDHISGFILNTPNDRSGKYIIGLNETINIIQKHYFNNQAWADFGSTGLKTYDYQILDPLSTESVRIMNTDLNVRIFRLCHTCPFLSSAFLISRREQPFGSVLYLGDSGPDDIEKIIDSNNRTYYPRYLNKLWKSVTSLIAHDQLKAIFIEVSFANDRPDHLLFGHLTPKWLLKELHILNSYHSIEKVKIIITHIKPEQGVKEKIIEELKTINNASFWFVFPQQGEAIWL